MQEPLSLHNHSKSLHGLAERHVIAEKRRSIPSISCMHALQSEESGYGIARGLLQSLGAGRLKVQKPPIDESENERVLRRMERRVAQHPTLSPEEEQQLAHLVARSNTEKRRAERLHEAPRSPPR